MRLSAVWIDPLVREGETSQPCTNKENMFQAHLTWCTPRVPGAALGEWECVGATVSKRGEYMMRNTWRLCEMDAFK